MSTAGRYYHVFRLGEGTYGSVYRATERETGRVVAFKRMQIANQDDGVPGTTIREICLLKELRHPNVVEMFEVLCDPPKITLIFEYCDFDLKKYVDSKEKKCLDASEIKTILKQMFAGLRYLHLRGVVHRDLKPQNVFLNVRPRLVPLLESESPVAGNTTGSSNSTSITLGSTSNPNNTAGSPVAGSANDVSIVVKLGDFGLSRVENIPVKKYSHEVVTLWYRSPDVVMGTTLYSFPVDIWSMGVIFFEMVTGKVLFSGRNDNEQLLRMFRLLGSPTLETWPSMRTYPGTADRLESVQRLAAEQEARGSNTEAAASDGSRRSRRRSNSFSEAVSGSRLDSGSGGGGFDELFGRGGGLPQNTHNLPAELWYPFSLFDDYMTSSGFRGAVGEEGVDLLRGCLRYEPSQRLTTQEVMRHEFLRGYQVRVDAPMEALMASLQQALTTAGL